MSIYRMTKAEQREFERLKAMIQVKDHMQMMYFGELLVFLKVKQPYEVQSWGK